MSDGKYFTTTKKGKVLRALIPSVQRIVPKHQILARSVTYLTGNGSTKAGTGEFMLPPAQE